ncbi:chromosome transmission fidelity protein 18-like [Quillaja saponaria]|uniref:Chromosome transmission fidelity protein 18-like n=1 Tax=Quillaja saponaria TaxID=32244 RepID=A0AAD7LCG8_QUISA|nr:chromosome transmission fidelity protein 18-like [Quillaja saponaria]
MPAPPIPDSPLSSEFQVNGHKRLVSDDLDVSILENVGSSGGKRIRIDDPVPEHDEDWLRYLTPRKIDLAVNRSFGGRKSEFCEGEDFVVRLEQEAVTKTLEASSECQSGIICPETPILHEKLRMDKYALNSFTELLSDDQINQGNL